MTAVQWPVPSLLPHSGDMVLISAPASAGDDWAEATVRIGEDSVFYKPGNGVPSWAGAEYMAQTIALFAGVRARKSNTEIKIGLFVGSRRYEAMKEYFSLGQLLRIRVDQVWEDEQMAVFDCSIDGNQRLAEAQLNVFRPVDPQRFIQESRT